MLLTLDAIFIMDVCLQDQIIAEARELAGRDKNIIEEDCRHIIFCHIQALEKVMSLCSEDEFLWSLKAARQEKYAGWNLREINQEEQKEKDDIEIKKFPFSLDELLPWWTRVGEELNDTEK